jgi:hypothetical protein
MLQLNMDARRILEETYACQPLHENSCKRWAAHQCARVGGELAIILISIGKSTAHLLRAARCAYLIES